MVKFTVNMISEGNDKRVPIAIAGQVMVDIQDLFRHIGDFLIARELRLQEAVSPRLSDKFTLYLDQNGGLTMDASSHVPETEGYGNIIDDAVVLMESTLDALGSGTGGYWAEDTFTDALYRNQIIYDIVALHQDLSEYPGYALMYGSGDLKKFGKVDVEKMAGFIADRGLTVNNATVGMIEASASKSRNGKLSLSIGDRNVRLSFKNDERRKAAEGLVGKGPVVIAGTLVYSEEGKLVSIDDANDIVPMSSIKYRRMISETGDLALKNPITVDVRYNGKWILSNSDLGIEASKEDWDSAVEQFHSYFVFLWTEYSGKNDEELSDEEKEVKNFLLTLVA